jgi:lipopolysaccharide/colanic/teichoic acid biosynthesis glycosyltransferase
VSSLWLIIAAWVALELAKALVQKLVDEAFAWLPWLAERFVRRAARGLPRSERDRYLEEWLAELKALPGSGLSQVTWSIRLMLGQREMRRALRTVTTPGLKRAIDLAGATAVLTVCAPLLVVIALAIKLEGGGPVLFRQERVGRDGRRFRICKFRTMCIDAEGKKAQLRATNAAEGGLFKIADDPRVTRVGRFLRKTSLDELPQLLNVVTGDMSLVGPRPLLDDESQDGSLQDLKPGMTGPGQLNGGFRIPPEQHAKMLEDYMSRWSPWRDLKVIARTLVFVFQRNRW